MTNRLIRFWFSTDGWQGIGVTAYSLEDARTLIASEPLVGTLNIRRVVKDIDIRELDQGHIIPNMGPQMYEGYGTQTCIDRFTSFLANFAINVIFDLMTTMNISLPETLKSFVDSQVSDGDYTSSSEYVRELLRREKDRVRIRELLREGAASPVSGHVWDAEYFDQRRKRLKAQK